MRYLHRPRRSRGSHEFKPRKTDTRRINIDQVAAVLAEIKPEERHYATNEEYVAAVGMWDDLQRGLSNAIDTADRRARGQMRTLSQVVAMHVLSNVED